MATVASDTPAWLASREIHVGDPVVCAMKHGPPLRGTAVRLGRSRVTVRLALNGKVIERRREEVERER